MYLALGSAFTTLKDYEKGRGFMEKAVEFAASVQGDDLARKFRRMTIVGLAVPYTKLQRYASAFKLCEVYKYITFARYITKKLLSV